jgi:N-acetylneuraminic acid mutarotase
MKKQIASFVEPHLIRGAFYVLLLVSVSTIPFALGQRQARGQRTLTFPERVAYQRAIEEVYWRHRIWPKERPDAKPRLDAVISQEKLEKKVVDYLRKSQALADYWQRPITTEQLQTEMDRMAKNTKQPDVLRELFEALGNDPFVVAECLARPVLSERLTADFSVQDKTGYLKPARIKGPRKASSARAIATAAYKLPTISEGDPPCTDDMWTATSTSDAPISRFSHTAVWTGSEMIVWGGYSSGELNTGAKYNPGTDSWTAMSVTNAPSARRLHKAIWTGDEMIVWGGYNGSELNTGGRYNPNTDSWAAINTTNAPLARYYHTAVWTGSEMIIWAGYNNYTYLNTGGRYNPNTDSWTATSITNAPSARSSHTAVWAGSEMIVWGGYVFDGSSQWLNTGGRYDPALDSWTATSTTNVPTGRANHTAIWTGSEMVIWGGESDGGFTYLNTGGRYNPGTDNWIATSTNDAPTPRQFHTAIWTGSEMIVWSGDDGFSYLNTGERYWTPTSPPTPTPTPIPSPTPPIPGTGGRYDPSSDSWRATSTTNAPPQRLDHTAVWTGSDMIVWGGGDFNGSLNTGGRYCAQSGPTPTPTATSCSVTSAGCGNIVFVPPTDFTINVSDPVDPVTVDASDLTVNGKPADDVFLSNGDTTLSFIFNTSPAVQGTNTMHIPAGAFNCSLGDPVLEFTCAFRYEAPRLSPTPRPRPTPIPRP